jgi:ATP-binding cassette subfamily B protein
MLTLDDPRAPLRLFAAVLLSAAVAWADVVVLQAVLHATRQLALPQQRLAGVLVLLSLSCVGLALEVALTRVTGRIGRSLELRVRAALFEKLPRLADDYLRTRSTSDMAQRGHALHLLRGVPVFVRRALEALSSLASSCAGIALLYPQGALATLLAACATVIVPLTMMRSAGERSLRARTHMVALDRFYLDALVGVVPIRVHGAQRAVRREHESLLVEWARAALGMHAQTTWMQTVEALLSAGLLWSLVSAYLASDLPRSGLLLLVYWAGRMPAAGGALVDGMVVYRALQHAAVRLLSPLGAAEPARAAAELPAPAGARGVSLALRGVSVKVANRALLRDVELHVRAGEHVAVVGPSGAGKSSLIGLLLGWRSPCSGELQIDGARAGGAELAALRRQTAWVDPAVQLWNDSLLNNVLYGSADGALARLAEAMDHAQLGDVIESVPGGLQAPLGEAGACVSGGQGQRVRLARALLRDGARLVLLDEPFRGLSRELRQTLLCRVRQHFRDATLLFVSHDIRDTREFERVLVIDGGGIREDASPAALLERPDSRYRALLHADEHQRAFQHAAWRHAHMDAGRLAEPR